MHAYENIQVKKLKFRGLVPLIVDSKVRRSRVSYAHRCSFNSFF